MQEIPRGPIRRERSGNWDVTDNYERKMEDFRMASREEAMRTFRLNQEAGKVHSYIQALSGEGFWPANHRRWRSRFVDNRLAKCRIDHLAQLTDTRPIIDVTTANPAYADVAEAIAGVIRATWARADWDLKVVRAADIADAYGTGFMRLGAAWPGEQSALPCGPDQVMPIQPGFDIQESSAVRFATWKSLWWLKKKFPFTSDNLEREINMEANYGTSSSMMGGATLTKPNNIDEHTWQGLSQAMKNLLGVKGGPVVGGTIGKYYKTLEVEEFFVADPTCNDSSKDIIVSDPFLPFDQHNWWYQVGRGKPLFPRKRHMVFAGSKLLSDGPSPYWHGLYPFATLQFNPVFWSFWGLSRYRDLMPLNQAMNEIVAACLDIVKRSLNPTAITKEGAVSLPAWKQFYPDLPGMKLRVGANENLDNALRYMPAPEIPAYVTQMLTGWLAPEFDRMAGAIDVAAMSRKLQNPAADTIDNMRDAQNTSLRLEERLMEVFLRDSGTQVVSNILQFSTADYRMRLLGEQGLTKADVNKDLGTMLPEDINAQPDFWRQFAMKISAGSLHSGAKDRDKQVAMSLASKRLLPIIDMYEKLEIPDPEGTLQRLVQQMQAQAQLDGPVSGKRPA